MLIQQAQRRLTWGWLMELWGVVFTFGVEGDEAVTQRPVLHRLLQDHLLWKDDHVDVIKLAEALQDLSHGLGVGLLRHRTNSNHDLTLLQLQEQKQNERGGAQAQRWSSAGRPRAWMLNAANRAWLRG